MEATTTGATTPMEDTSLPMPICLEMQATTAKSVEKSAAAQLPLAPSQAAPVTVHQRATADSRCAEAVIAAAEARNLNTNT